MKKLSANIMLITAVLFFCTDTVEAGQNSAAKIHIDLDTATAGIQTTRTADVGEIFDVDIVINDAVNLKIFNLVVTFPQTILEIQEAGVTQGFDLFPSLEIFKPEFGTPGKVEVTGGVMDDNDAVSGDGVLFHLRFKVLSTEQADLQFLGLPDTQLLRDNSSGIDDPVDLGNANGATVNSVDPDQSTVEATTPVTADGISTSTITITAIDTNGEPMQGIAAADILVSSTGTGNTITQPTAATDASGQTTATISSTVAETKIISVTIDGTDINNTATVVFTDVPLPTVGFISTTSGYSESITSVDLEVVLSKQSADIVKVNYSVSNGTATGGGEDYTLFGTGVLEFSPGSTSEPIKITVHEDSLYEGNETIEVTLSSPTNAILGTNTTHTYTITNNDPLPTVGFDVGSSDDPEDNSPAELTVNISAASGLDVIVNYSVTGVTATGGQDYTTTGSTLTFPAGENDPQTIDITIIDDSRDEDDETFTVTLNSATNADIGTANHTYKILDNDDPPSVSFDSAGSQGDEGTVSQVELVVNLSEASGKTVTVNYTVTGTATGGGEDYTIAAGPLIFAPGETTKNIILSIVNDDVGEADETVDVLLEPTNATLGDNPSYTYTIENDDKSSIEFADVSSSGPEGNNIAELIVTLSPEFPGEVKVGYSVTGGTATGGGVDYTLLAGTLTFQAGDTEESITIDITHDTEVEPDETIIVTLSEPSKDATIGTNESHTYTILNDDDEIDPNVSGFIPEPNSIQVARDTIIQLHITDEVIAGASGTGVDANFVQIQVEGEIIYNGLAAEPNGTYNSTMGICRRMGTEADYTFVFQASALFDYEQKVDVVVKAEDKAGNLITEDYYFHTVMRSFGKNIKVNSDTGALVQNNPATAIDSAGNIWVVWDETTAAGDTDIYIGKLSADESAFETSRPVIKSANDQRNPAIAIDDDDKLYVVWEEIEEIADPNRDILLLTSTDGNIWKYELSSDPFKVNADNPDDKAPNMTQNPAIAIRGTEMYITWDEKRGTNKDIWVRQSAIAPFDWKVATQVTDDPSSQSGPAIAMDEFGTAYIVWTDARNSDTDIYGASSAGAGAWTNEKIVSSPPYNQWSPAIATESSGTVLHLLWVDDTDPNDSIFYRATADGLQWPLEVDPNVVDEPKYAQSAPAIAVSGAGETAKVFACWQDARWINKGDVADIYFTENGSGFHDRTNVLVNDDGVDENTQTAPDIGDIGVDKYGNPYIVWVDDRNGNNDIYYAGPITIGEPLPTEVKVDDVNEITTVEATTPDNRKVTLEIPSQPLGVDPNDITIREIDVNDLPALPPGSFGVPYDLGPSGLKFSPPVTVTIQHAKEDCPGHSVYNVYWYNTETGTWSQEGITDVEHLTPADDPSLSSGVHVVRFKTTHFTGFGIGGGAAAAAIGGGGGGGGCDMSATGQGNVIEYMLPYVFLTIVWIIIKRKDARNRKTIV